MNKPTLEFDPDDIDSIPEGGMGLYIIDQLMTDSNYSTDNGINTFTMKKILN
jgi:serine/threonine-protein kinase RsbW